MSPAAPAGAVSVLPVTWKLDNLTLGTADAAGCWWIVRKSDGWYGAPKPKTQRSPNPGGPGSYRAAGFTGERIIILTGTTKCPSVLARLTAQDQLAAMAANPRTLYELVVTDQRATSRVVQVELDAKTDVVVHGEHWFDWQMQLACPDPRKRDYSWQQPQSGPPTAGTGGASFVAPGLDFSGSGIDWGSAGTSTSAQVANFGTAPVSPLFEVVGPSTTPSITDLTTGEVVTFSGVLDTGDVLSINCDVFPQRGFPGRSCYVNGTSNRRTQLTLPGDWPEVGASEVHTYGITAGGGSNSTLTVFLRSAWY